QLGRTWAEDAFPYGTEGIRHSWDSLQEMNAMHSVRIPGIEAGWQPCIDSIQSLRHKDLCLARDLEPGPDRNGSRQQAGHAQACPALKHHGITCPPPSAA